MSGLGSRIDGQALRESTRKVDIALSVEAHKKLTWTLCYLKQQNANERCQL